MTASFGNGAMPQMWMVRSGRKGDLLREFLDNQRVALGFGGKPDLSEARSPEQVRRLLSEMRGHAVSQLAQFRTAMRVGDEVVTYDTKKRVYHIGRVTGEYRYDPSAVDQTTYAHTRSVAWGHRVRRDDLSEDSKKVSSRRGSSLINLPLAVQEELARLEE